MIPFVYLHANIFPYLRFIENKRPDGDSVYLLWERWRNSPNLYFDFAFDYANGSMLREVTDILPLFQMFFAETPTFNNHLGMFSRLASIVLVNKNWASEAHHYL